MARVATYGRDAIIPVLLDQAHLWEALRYAELNPIRAGIGRRGGVLALVECVGSLPQGDGQRLINSWCRGRIIGLRRRGASTSQSGKRNPN